MRRGQPCRIVLTAARTKTKEEWFGVNHASFIDDAKKRFRRRILKEESVMLAVEEIHCDFYPINNRAA